MGVLVDRRTPVMIHSTTPLHMCVLVWGLATYVQFLLGWFLAL